METENQSTIIAEMLMISSEVDEIIEEYEFNIPSLNVKTIKEISEKIYKNYCSVNISSNNFISKLVEYLNRYLNLMEKLGIKAV